MKKFFSNGIFRRFLRGFGLVESLVSITVFSLVASLIASTLVTVNESSIGVNHRAEAERFLQESYEAVSFLRDENFLNLANGTHGLALNNGTWPFSGSQDIINNFYTRQITITDVYRDGSNNIITTGGSLDARTKQVDIGIAWTSETEGAKQLSSRHFLSDWRSFDRITTAESEWNQGTHNQTATSNSGNGTLILGTSSDSWNNSINNQSYAFAPEHNADVNTITVVGNMAYIVSDFQGGEENFEILNVASPTTVSIVGATSLGDSSHGLDVAISGNYAYVATTKDNRELTIVSISDSSNPQVVGGYDVQNTASAESIRIDGTRLYLGMEENSAKELYIFDIQDPVNPVIIGQFETDDDVADIAVNSNIAYLAVDNDEDTLWVLDVTNAGNIQELATHPVTPEDGEALAYHDGKIYFTSEETGSGQEFKILDVSNPAQPSVLGGVELGAEGSGVDVFDTFAFIATNKGDEEFQVIDISNPGSPQLKKTFDLNGQGNGVFANQNAVYVTTNNNSSPVYIFTYPEEVYENSGTFTSAGIDSGSDATIWKTFNWEGVLLSGTSVSFQIRTADSQGHLNSATWVGSDGTGSTNYTAKATKITTSPNASGTRWIQYKATLTGNGSNTPEITAVRLQYEP